MRELLEVVDDRELPQALRVERGEQPLGCGWRRTRLADQVLRDRRLVVADAGNPVEQVKQALDRSRVPVRGARELQRLLELDVVECVAEPHEPIGLEAAIGELEGPDRLRIEVGLRCGGHVLLA